MKEELHQNHRYTQRDTPALESVTSQQLSVPLAAVDGNQSTCTLSPVISRESEGDVLNFPLEFHNEHVAKVLNILSPDQNNSTIDQDAFMETCHLNGLEDGARATRRVDDLSPGPTYVNRKCLPDSFVSLMLHWTNLAKNEICVL